MIIGGLHGNPLPVEDILPQGLGFDDIAKYFSALVHQWAEPKAKPRFALTPNLCVLALMPVTKTANGVPTTAWVPFLIDTASPRTYFTGATIEDLGLGRADHVVAQQTSLAVAAQRRRELLVIVPRDIDTCEGTKRVDLLLGRVGMRRLWSSFSLPRTRHVIIGGLHCNPLPVGDSLLQDLSFDDIAGSFSTLVHQPAEPAALRVSCEAMRLIKFAKTGLKVRATEHATLFRLTHQQANPIQRSRTAQKPFQS